ncbi:MAG: hypothetical protein GY853_07770 [PVC group bacterium]|nr:hypothetical protein [PVC group bacterium]
MEILFKIAITIVASFLIYYQIVFVKYIWTSHIDVKATLFQFVKQATPRTDTIAIRDPSKIYQNGEQVGSIIGAPKIEENIIVFEKISETKNLKREQFFEYKRDKYKIIKIEKSAVLDISSSSGQLNHTLTNVTCEKINP